MNQYLVLDVGGSSIKVALMDETGAFLEKHQMPTPLDGKQHYYEVLNTIITPYLDKVKGLAFSAPGIIDSETGFAYTGGALQFIENLDIKGELEAMFYLPVTIGNDAKCAAMAEVGYGNLMDVDDAIALILGTGIGGAIIKDKKIHQGKHFSAGEFSFILSNYKNPAELRDSFAIISGTIGLKASVAAASGKQDLNGKEIFQLANAGDEAVTAGIRQYCKNLAVHIYNLQTVYDPERFVIGGGISAQPLLFTLLKEELNNIYDAIPYPIPRADITACRFGNDANLLGALFIHLSQFPAN